MPKETFRHSRLAVQDEEFSKETVSVGDNLQPKPLVNSEQQNYRASEQYFRRERKIGERSGGVFFCSEGDRERENPKKFDKLPLNEIHPNLKKLTLNLEKPTISPITVK